MSIEGSVAAYEGAPAHALGEQVKSLAATGILVTVTDRIEEIAPAWRALEAEGLFGPAQSYDFNRIWMESLDVPRAKQAFVLVTRAGRPFLVLALVARRQFGLRTFCSAAGRHAGSATPLIDRAVLDGLSAQERVQMWQKVLDGLGADLLRLEHVVTDDLSLFGSKVCSIPSDTLYRSEFDSWAQCDKEQRSRSRRKHDKQQGAKLAALGTVLFEELDAEADVDAALDAMFADRAARFAEQGIADPFASAGVRAFYRSVFSQGQTLKGVMHVLKLDGRIVATRYNMVAGENMFCLISSMSTDPVLQPGSPGKQILVHIMQSVFDAGLKVFDLGVGFSDEKRHWCNVQVPLSHVYLPRTLRGRLVARLLLLVAGVKAKIKSDQALFERLKSMRAKLGPRLGR